MNRIRLLLLSAICLLALLALPKKQARQPAHASKPETPLLQVAFSDQSRFGFTSSRQRDPHRPGHPLPLTRGERGLTNNTCVWIDGFTYLFGTVTPEADYATYQDTLQRNVQVGKNRWRSVMDFEQFRVRVIQNVAIIKGPDSRHLDTARVTYRIENRDTKPHKIGLRFLFDTCIADNEGVPIYVPAAGSQSGTVVDSLKIIRRAQMPANVQAIDEQTRTAVTIGLQPPGCEPLEQLVICRWPGNSDIRWDWPFEPIDEPQRRVKDSCLVLYWQQVRMQPGARREMGMTFGLVESDKMTPEVVAEFPAWAPVRLFTTPSIYIEKEFYLSAYVKGGKGKVTVEIPDGLTLRRGAVEQVVPLPEMGNKYAEVSWHLVAPKEGYYIVRVRHDRWGITEIVFYVLPRVSGHPLWEKPQPMIKKAFGPQLRLLTSPSPVPGKVFEVRAFVKGGGGKINLEVPRGMQMVDSKAEQEVPPPSEDLYGYALVTWKVKAVGKDYVLRVKHSKYGSAKVKIRMSVMEPIPSP